MSLTNYSSSLCETSFSSFVDAPTPTKNTHPDHVSYDRLANRYDNLENNVPREYDHLEETQRVQDCECMVINTSWLRNLALSCIS